MAEGDTMRIGGKTLVEQADGTYQALVEKEADEPIKLEGDDDVGQSTGHKTIVHLKTTEVGGKNHASGKPQLSKENKALVDQTAALFKRISGAEIAVQYDDKEDVLRVARVPETSFQSLTKNGFQENEWKKFTPQKSSQVRWLIRNEHISQIFDDFKAALGTNFPRATLKPFGSKLHVVEGVTTEEPPKGLGKTSIQVDQKYNLAIPAIRMREIFGLKQEAQPTNPALVIKYLQETVADLKGRVTKLETEVGVLRTRGAAADHIRMVRPAPGTSPAKGDGGPARS